LFVIGDAKTLERCNRKWAMIVANARDRGFFIAVSTVGRMGADGSSEMELRWLWLPCSTPARRLRRRSSCLRPPRQHPRQSVVSGPRTRNRPNMSRVSSRSASPETSSPPERLLRPRNEVLLRRPGLHELGKSLILRTARSTTGKRNGLKRGRWLRMRRSTERLSRLRNPGRRPANELRRRPRLRGALRRPRKVVMGWIFSRSLRRRCHSLLEGRGRGRSTAGWEGTEGDLELLHRFQWVGRVENVRRRPPRRPSRCPAKVVVLQLHLSAGRLADRLRLHRHRLLPEERRWTVRCCSSRRRR
jgi:hypothetical protein